MALKLIFSDVFCRCCVSSSLWSLCFSYPVVHRTWEELLSNREVYTIFHLNAPLPQCSVLSSRSNLLCIHQHIHFTLERRICCLWSSTEAGSHPLCQLTESNFNQTRNLKDSMSGWHAAGRWSDWMFQPVVDTKELDSISTFWPWKTKTALWVAI